MAESPQSPNGTPFPMVPGRAAAATKIAAIVEVIEATGLPPRQAAMSVGISSSAFYRLVDANKDATEAFENATAVHARRMASVIARAAVKHGSVRAAEFWLERRLPDTYGPRAHLTVAEEELPRHVQIARDPNVTTEDLDAQLDALTEELIRRRDERRRDKERKEP